MISYEPLWKTMSMKKISTYKLIQEGIDKRTIYNLKHGESITMITAERLCKIIDCRIEDIVEFIDDTK